MISTGLSKQLSALTGRRIMAQLDPSKFQNLAATRPKKIELPELPEIPVAAPAVNNLPATTFSQASNEAGMDVSNVENIDHPGLAPDFGQNIDTEDVMSAVGPFALGLALGVPGAQIAPAIAKAVGMKQGIGYLADTAKKYGPYYARKLGLGNPQGKNEKGNLIGTEDISGLAAAEAYSNKDIGAPDISGLEAAEESYLDKPVGLPDISGLAAAEAKDSSGGDYSGQSTDGWGQSTEGWGQSKDTGPGWGTEALGATNSESGVDSGGEGEGGGGSVLCTYMNERGYLPDHILEADNARAKDIDRLAISGYHAWAIPLVEVLRKSWLLTQIFRPFVCGWATEMAYQMEVAGKGSRIGKILEFIGIPICFTIGFVKENFKWAKSTTH